MGRTLSFNCVKESVNPNHTNAAFVLRDTATACLLLLRYTIYILNIGEQTQGHKSILRIDQNYGKSIRMSARAPAVELF